MTRLIWGAVGSHHYEAGIDRGVLYVSGVGYPWPGLQAVTQSPTGGEAKPYYLDGVKYLNMAAAEDFAATIKAFSAPPQFAVCDGISQVAAGLFATEQPRKPFSLSYRTKLGSDSLGLERGYKLHLVYNAMAAPSARDNVSLGSTVSPMQLSWGISTTPVAVTGMKPTAHLILNSTLISTEKMTTIENNLYGTDIIIPHMLTAAEIVTILTA